MEIRRAATLIRWETGVAIIPSMRRTFAVIGRSPRDGALSV
jgi:hypothetical protein